jgi:hypothetical protein
VLLLINNEELIVNNRSDIAMEELKSVNLQIPPAIIPAVIPSEAEESPRITPYALPYVVAVAMVVCEEVPRCARNDGRDEHDGRAKRDGCARNGVYA